MAEGIVGVALLFVMEICVCARVCAHVCLCLCVFESVCLSVCVSVFFCLSVLVHVLIQYFDFSRRVIA